jgi:hypothetical protein
VPISFHIQKQNEYFAFFSQGAAIMTGFGFTGYTENGGSKWNGAANVDIMQIEFPSNFKVLLDSWNMKTNIWLRECIYKRVTPRGVKPGFASSMLTFATSAFWVCYPSSYIILVLGKAFKLIARLRGWILSDFHPGWIHTDRSENGSKRHQADLPFLQSLINYIWIHMAKMLL